MIHNKVVIGGLAAVVLNCCQSYQVMDKPIQPAHKEDEFVPIGAVFIPTGNQIDIPTTYMLTLSRKTYLPAPRAVPVYFSHEKEVSKDEYDQTVVGSTYKEEL